MLRVSAFVALASIVAAQTPVDQAIAALSSKDPIARKDALAKINATANPQAAGAVARLIGDPQLDVQQAAIDTLLTLVMPTPSRNRPSRGGTVRRAPKAPTGEERARALLIEGVHPVRPVPAVAFDPLADVMSDADSRARPTATYAFGVLATSKDGLVPTRARSRALAALVKMIASPHQDTRIVGMEVAGRAFAASPEGEPPAIPVGGPGLSDALVTAMNLPDVADQRAAIEALGRLRERRAQQAISDRFVYHREHGERPQAVTALEALARIGDPTTASLVRSLIESKWTRWNDTRLAMLFARARLFKDGSDEALRRAADDKDTGAQARAYLLELGIVP